MSEQGLRLRCAAPGKVNPHVAVGRARPDGRHDQLLVLQAVSLADEVTLETGPGVTVDEVRCPGVAGENLAATAVARFRAVTGWDGPPVRITIEKRVPVAAGMGGGSADAGAALRLLAAAADLGEPTAALLRVARGLGADVPHAVLGGLASDVDAEASHVLAAHDGTVAGAAVLLRSGEGLRTGDVYAEADRLGRLRSPAALRAAAAAVREALPGADAAADAAPARTLPPALWTNDLQPPALSLRPDIGEALDALTAAGARHVLVSGSGPTALGWFADRDAAERAARGLAARTPVPVVAEPVTREAGDVVG